MHFRTELSVNKSLLQLDHKTHFLTIGSCFSEEIGTLLAIHKFHVLNNPFGTTFNPLSIARIIQGMCSPSPTCPSSLQAGEVWLDYHFHSSVFGYDEQELKLRIEHLMKDAKTQLNAPKPVLILTLGTAWVYRLRSTGDAVANCHKQPAALFKKELCASVDLLKHMQSALDKLFQTFPACQVILTLSPVRHTKDGLEENQISKSLLRTLCHELNTRYQQVHYFPSYEIILDDLRDYRFYAKDLVHPNAQAVEYIWEKFCQVFFSEPTNRLVEEWKLVRQHLAHKPFYDKSSAHKKFMEQTLLALESLSNSIDVKEEIQTLKHTIQSHSSHESSR